jgi:hypothetical protein
VVRTVHACGTVLAGLLGAGLALLIAGRARLAEGTPPIGVDRPIDAGL